MSPAVKAWSPKYWTAREVPLWTALQSPTRVNLSYIHFRSYVLRVWYVPGRFSSQEMLEKWTNQEMLKKWTKTLWTCPWDFQPLQSLTFEIFRTPGTQSPSFLETEESWLFMFGLDCWNSVLWEVTTEHPFAVPAPLRTLGKGWQREAHKSHGQGRLGGVNTHMARTAQMWEPPARPLLLGNPQLFIARCLIPTTLQPYRPFNYDLQWPFPRSRLSFAILPVMVTTKYPLRSFDHCLTLRITGVWTVTLLYRRNQLSIVN